MKRQVKASKFKRKGAKQQHHSRLTESLTPGTTLRCIPMTLTPKLDERQRARAIAAGAHFQPASGSGMGTPPPLVLLDTPGQIIQTAVPATAQLTLSDARLLHPKRPLKPTPIELRPGKAVLLGGLAVVEHSAGTPVIIRAFVAEGVTVHSTDASRVEDIRHRHCGALLTPPSADSGAQSETPLDAARIPSSLSGSSGTLYQALALEESLAELELEQSEQKQDQDHKTCKEDIDDNHHDNDEDFPEYIDVDISDDLSAFWDAEELGSWEAIDASDGGSTSLCNPPKLSSKAFSLDFSNCELRTKRSRDEFDIVISGLGWISVRLSDAGNVAHSVTPASTITVSAPLGTLKLLRTPALLPFADGHRPGKRRSKRDQAPRRAKHFTKKRVWTPVHQRVSKKRRGY